jgi:hypothetical protein
VNRPLSPDLKDAKSAWRKNRDLVISNLTLGRRNQSARLPP